MNLPSRVRKIEQALPRDPDPAARLRGDGLALLEYAEAIGLSAEVDAAIGALGEDRAAEIAGAAMAAPSVGSGPEDWFEVLKQAAAKPKRSRRSPNGRKGQ